MTLIITLLTIVAVTGGLFKEGLYKDTSNFVLSAWYATDLVTLVVGVPLLIVALIFSLRGSLRGQLVWLGMLIYTLYNYSYYLLGASLNSFFLIYVALFCLSMYAIIFGLVNLDYEKIAKSFKGKTPVKAICVYMIILGLILGGAWTSQWLNFVVTGNLPQVMINVNSSTNLVASLDLTVVVPLCIVAAFYLWKRMAIGYVLAVMLNVKGTVYNLILISGSILQADKGVKGAMDLVPLWIFLGIGCLSSLVILLINIRPVQTEGKSMDIAG
jgi:hypothetical protein